MRINILAVICAVISALGLVTSTNLDGRIHGGDYATLGDFPHHVHLQIYSNNNLFVCGGSLVRYNWIITAAQCVNRFEYIQASLGLVNREDGPIRHILIIDNEDHVRKHPDYNPPDVISHDIALIYLAEAKREWLDHDYVGTVGLPTSLNDDFFGLNALATGFGLTSDDQSVGISSTLKYVIMPVISNEICSEIFGDVIVDSKICTNTTYGSTCAGDEGGGLITEIQGIRIIIGVVSFRSAAGCTVSHPAVFTRVTEYIGWIQENFENPPKDPEPPNVCNCDCHCHTCPALQNDLKKEL